MVRVAAQRGGRPVFSRDERILRSVNPSVAIENVRTLAQTRSDSLASRAFAMQLQVGSSLIGSVLSLVGSYGVLSLSVAWLRREHAIRTAIGGGQGDIRRLGICRGIPADRRRCGLRLVALALARVLRALLFWVGPTDPATLVGVALLFAAVAMLACWAPGRRTGKIDTLWKLYDHGSSTIRLRCDVDALAELPGAARRTGGRPRAARSRPGAATRPRSSATRRRGFGTPPLSPPLGNCILKRRCQD